MIVISHRGNLDGPNMETENHPNQIIKVLQMNIDCEIDVWMMDGQPFLGHDMAQYCIDSDFLMQKGLWIHAKNLDALTFCQSLNTNVFFHDSDDYTLTSKNYIWAYPGKITNAQTIIVLKGQKSPPPGDVLGICTDYPLDYGQ